MSPRQLWLFLLCNKWLQSTAVQNSSVCFCSCFRAGNLGRVWLGTALQGSLPQLSPAVWGLDGTDSRQLMQVHLGPGWAVSWRTHSPLYQQWRFSPGWASRRPWFPRRHSPPRELAVQFLKGERQGHLQRACEASSENTLDHHVLQVPSPTQSLFILLMASFLWGILILIQNPYELFSLWMGLFASFKRNLYLDVMEIFFVIHKCWLFCLTFTSSGTCNCFLCPGKEQVECLFSPGRISNHLRTVYEKAFAHCSLAPCWS